MASREHRHTPVLLREVIAALNPKAGAIFVDGTFGGGGYSRALLEAADCVVWGIDRDPLAISRGAALVAAFPGRLALIHGRFGAMRDLLREQGVSAVDGVVLDLGLSSPQIDEPARRGPRHNLRRRPFEANPAMSGRCGNRGRCC